VTTRARSRVAEIAADIESTILKAGASAGAHVGLRKDLLEQYGASPSVINEALRILRERGLITVKPGAYGGVFVADDVQWVQLAGINMWFRKSSHSPLEMFQSRIHLEDTLTRAALERSVPEDLRNLEWAFEDLTRSTATAREYWQANLRFHTAIARASHLDFLADMYQALVITLSQALMHAEFIDERHDELLAHNIEVHRQLVDALRNHDVELLDKILIIHRGDLVRAGDPAFSPKA
jgi:DNA-binding FadR family transcriptional regulator